MLRLRFVVLLALAGACSGHTLHKSVPDGGPRDGVEAPVVERRPRWIALGGRFGLSVVRFDDATAPVTTILAWVDLPNRTPPASQPAVVLAAQVDDNTEIISESISWSMDGHHLAFATREAVSIRLYVASAADGFVPNEILLGAAGYVIPRWISDETLVFAQIHDEQMDFGRVSAPDWLAEPLGSYFGIPDRSASGAGNATFNPGWAGALYSLGSPAAGELWLARGKESPRRLGTALLEGGRPCRYRLTWSLDGESAVWWGRTEPDLRSLSDLGCEGPPPVEFVPGTSPAIGVEVQPTRITRQYVTDPASSNFGTTTYSWSVISGAVAGAPAGPAIAYGICQARWSSQSLPEGRSYLGTLVVKGAAQDGQIPPPRQEAEAAVCDADHPTFGFINATDYFFARRRALPDGGLAKFEFIVNRQGREHVVHDGLSGISEAHVFARGHHLFIAGADESGQGLWSVDLAAPTPSAQRVALDVAAGEGLSQRLRPNSVIPLLRASAFSGRISDKPIGDIPDRESLLVGIQESSRIPCDSYFLCSRWLVVDFAQDPTVVPLDSVWREWDLNWAPDGQGLLAVGLGEGEGVYYLTGPGYRDQYRLAEAEESLFLPPRWPTQ